MDTSNIGNTQSGGAQDIGSQATRWLQDYQSGAHDQVPHHEVHQAYKKMTQDLSPDQAQEATAQGFQQVPAAQRPGIAQSLIGLLQKHGLSPQDAGVQTTDPNQMSPNDMARLTNHVQQQQPDALQHLFQKGGALSNPMVGIALAGALAYGASKYLPRK